MLHSHKLIDNLIGKSDDLDMLFPSRKVTKDLEALAALITQAEKFDFGKIDFPITSRELTEVGTQIQFDAPQLTDDEQEAFQEGLIPLPSQVCYYEFELAGYCFGLLICDDVKEDDDWLIMPFTLFKNLPNRCYCIWAGVNFTNYGKLDIVTGHRRNIQFYRMGDVPSMNSYKLEEKISVGSAVPLALYLTLMLNSKTTEKRREITPPKLNAAREKRGKPPIPDHTIVRIIPERYVRNANAEAGKTHASPRLHWRRSHIRVLHRDEPGEKKVLIARHLVGREDLGTVTHEYKVLG